MKHRELKFRAWSRLQNKYIEKWYPVGYNNGVLCGIMETENEDETTDDGIVFQQCIGFKDKNGRELYEGDICTDMVGESVKVMWNNDDQRFEIVGVDDEEYVDSICRAQVEKMEIIGTLFENTELLLSEEEMEEGEENSNEEE